MHIPVGKKVMMLKEFHTHLYQNDWCFMESTEKDKAVLEEFPVVCLNVSLSMCMLELCVRIVLACCTITTPSLQLIM